MAKQAPKDPRPFLVTVNGGHPGPWTVEAPDAATAITQVIDTHHIKRDRRNFHATPVDAPAESPPKVPTFPVQPPAAAK